MFCPQCGNKVLDNAKFCHNCGENIAEINTSGNSADSNLNPNPGYTANNNPAGSVPPNNSNPGQTSNTAWRYTSAPNSDPKPLYYKSYDAQIPEAVHPMKWYNFSIYFNLYANMVFAFITSIILFNGYHYGVYAEYYFYRYDGLKAVDIVVGITFISYAIIAMATRAALKNKLASASKFIVALYMCEILAYLIYIIGYSTIGFETEQTTQYVYTIIIRLVVMALELVYYKKREDVFVN